MKLSSLLAALLLLAAAAQAQVVEPTVIIGDPDYQGRSLRQSQVRRELDSSCPITYVYSGVGTGSLDGTSFVGAPFIIEAQADTSNIGPWCCSDRQNTHTSASVSIDGVGTYDFLTPTHTWNSDSCCGGFGVDLFANLITFGSAIGNSDLATDFGPVTDPGASALQWGTNNVQTTGGRLIIGTLIGGATFEARDCLSESPTQSPTKNPTESPTKNPTESPTKNPTESPTVSWCPGDLDADFCLRYDECVQCTATDDLGGEIPGCVYHHEVGGDKCSLQCISCGSTCGLLNAEANGNGKPKPVPGCASACVNQGEYAEACGV